MHEFLRIRDLPGICSAIDCSCMYKLKTENISAKVNGKKSCRAGASGLGGDSCCSNVYLRKKDRHVSQLGTVPILHL